jgi:CRISPR-associated endonuclease/helicase Cas3
VSLTPADFDAFFREVHDPHGALGLRPFRWQQVLAERVVTERAWPEVIDLPTGVGKTACIDIAIFALALDAASSDRDRWCPRRIAMVVDRRVVVDQAARRGRAIARALRTPHGPVTRRVSDALRSLSVEGTPLAVTVLRGGIPRDDGWARAPDQPLVIASTVDQLGSRLLFRGYGVSRSMAPVHAGLAGNDTLILLDEVHLSHPFQQTLEAVATTRNGSFLRNRLHFVSLSATPGTTSLEPFRLTNEDRGQGSPLYPRLEAKKPARLEECERRDRLIEIASNEASALVQRGHRAVAVVVNRVDTAHRVVKRLRELHPEGDPVDIVLLTGRMRPVDRDDVVAELEPRVSAAAKRRQHETPPMIAVATQCIEAGADFDFDALVTEHASLDALRQRFGRVDRLGEYEKGEGVVIAVKEPNEKGKLEVAKDDPIYGGSLAMCWKMLQELDGKKKAERVVDFGVGALERKLHGKELSAYLAPKPRAPALFPAYLDLWIQTSPQPIVEPDVPLFLHGPKAGPADIQVVWRVDLDDKEIWTSDDDDEPPALGRVAALPPSSLEAVSVPYVLARRWLVQDLRDSATDGDVELTEEDERAPRPRVASAEPLGVVWRGDESFVLTAGRIAEVRPGDTIVVPASRGGLYRGSFDPEDRAPVPDVAERANLVGRGRPVLRVHPAVLDALGIAFVAHQVEVGTAAAPWLRRLAAALAGARRIVVDEALTVLRGRRFGSNVDEMDADDVGGDVTTDEETSSFTGRPVKLLRHSRDVEEWAGQFATKLGLSGDLVAAVKLAGWLHDVGKADPRFQRLLRDGSEISIWKAQSSEPTTWQLAKSGMAPQERRRMRQAAYRSGYPRGTRHELLSLAMIHRSPQVLNEASRRGVTDLELVFHLVASHHGWCRPFPPAVEEPLPDMIVRLRHGDMDLEASAGHRLETLDSPISDRFFALVAKYGWYGLAWLESVVRLADHRASEQEAADGDA